jgi:hypothetical protein
VDAIAAAILRQLDRRDRGEPVPALPPRLLEPFERRSLTRRLAGVYDLAAGDEAALSPAPVPRVATGSA